ncbi:MAG: glycosyltransferase family 2 protein [Bacteroidia bacterium]|nr:glycosyltransferase family 2 protein [Bacteroidia bacterium]
MKDNYDYSIVVPVYSGEFTIKELFNKIEAAFISINKTFEIIFVHDRGIDNSWEVICNLKNQNPTIIKAIQLTRNYGQHNAIICGFEYTSGNYIITLDEDLQHDPADIIKLIIKELDTDADVVYGWYKENEQTFIRKLLSKIFRYIILKGIPGLYSFYSPFRLLKKDIAKATIGMQNSYTFLDGYLTWITSDFEHVNVSHSRRISGKSSYNFSKLITHSINVFVTFSNLPYKILFYLGTILSFSAVIYSVYILLRKILFDDLLPGFATLNILLSLGFGITLLGMGILGEYLQRINQKSTKKPNYLIKHEK